jgi:hypothetical protein
MTEALTTAEPNALVPAVEQALNEEWLERGIQDEHRLPVDPPENLVAAKSPCCGCCGG